MNAAWQDAPTSISAATRSANRGRHRRQQQVAEDAADARTRR